MIIDHIHADGTLLRVLPKVAGKDPLEFEIKKLFLRSVGKDRPMEFQATLTNPKPPGLIQSKGHFGPWQSGEPGYSPVDGHYTFSNADLGVFDGIAGTLSSEGDYKGRLNRIEVAGTTDTPNFVVKTGGHPVPMKTKFQAIVDGTDGDTYLQPVEATLLNTILICRGAVANQPGTPGKYVNLDIRSDKGRIEDLLRLAVNSDQPIMKGATLLQTHFLLPPGTADVMRKLRLEGKFGVVSGHFTSPEVHAKIAELSARAKGKPKEAQELAATPGSVTSDLRAVFTYRNAAIQFSDLAFNVPGANIRLAGSYDLRGETMDFHGRLQMQAKVSQTMTGWKSWMLKPADPFFSKKGGGSDIAFNIGGTKKDPKFGLDLFGKKKK